MEKEDIKMLLLEIESACELVEDGQITYEQFGKLVYEYMVEPVVCALSSKLSDK